MKKIFALIFATYASVSFAQPGPPQENLTPEEIRRKRIQHIFMSPQIMGAPVPMITLEGRHDKAVEENKINLAIPILKNESDSMTVSLNGSQLYITKPMTLNSSNYIVPQTLSRLELGLQYNKRTPDFKNWGLRGTIGYAGDKPSAAGSEMTYSFMATYGYMSENKKGFWNWMLMMSNNGPFINYFPIVGFVYLHKTPTFTGLFGFPILSMQWDLTPDLKYSLALIATNINTELTYGYIDKYQLYAHYSVTQQSYIPKERKVDKDRLNFQEQKAALGIRFPIKDHIMIEAQSGYSYDRSVYMGDKLLNKDRGSKPIDSEWYGNLSLKFAI